ncbi:unnamed protein product [Strongylus vulgaris]|uniref:Uncharacterized protein n=1 Tax=Strongylus vulgaris TaxID=40348 RepID=A0A3P7IQK9_STRVU|nr:unnamed protein product [Strongylus vulgaris]
MLFDIPRPNRRAVLPTQRVPAESSSNMASARRSMLLDRAGSGTDLTIVSEDVSHVQNSRPAPRGLVAPQKVSIPSTKRATVGASAVTTPVERAPPPISMVRSEIEDINDTIVVPDHKAKSSTVANIEKLQKEREERRAQQVVIVFLVEM